MTQPPNPAGYPDPNLPPQAEPGYVPPQGGYAPPPGGFPPPPPATPPPGYASNEEKTWALVSTFGGAAGTFISGGFLAAAGPLIAYLVKGKESPTVKAHSTAALNFFMITSGVWIALTFLWICVGILPGVLTGLVRLLIDLIYFLNWVAGIAFGIIAGLKANEGQPYKYPVSLSVIK